MAFAPQVMCASCERVFASDARLDEEAVCPVCGHRAPPARVMRVSGFSSLETFVSNWRKQREETRTED